MNVIWLKKRLRGGGVAAAFAACLFVFALQANGSALAPSFGLQRMTGGTEQFQTGNGRVTVLVFISNRCPMSNAFNERLNSLYHEFHRRLTFLVVNANDNESLAAVAEHAKTMDYEFPVYKDRNNLAADLFEARYTPESFVVDRSGMVIYRGYIEDAPNPARAKNKGLRLAIEAALENRIPLTQETHGIGCSIRRAKLR